MQAKKIDTRTRLLAAASDLIWSGSFHAVGVDEICRRADVRKGSFYHFFPSKTELAAAALEASWEQVRDGVFDPLFAEGEPGLSRLVELIGAVDRFQRGEHEARGVYLGCPFGSVGQEMAHQDERLQAVVDAVFEGHVDYFERALAEAVERGEARPGDLRNRARSLFALFEGALLVAKVGNRPERFTELARSVELLARADEVA